MYVVGGKNKHRKPNIEMDKLGRFLKERDLNNTNLTLPNQKSASLFDAGFSIYLFGTACSQHIHQSRIRCSILSAIIVLDLIELVLRRGNFKS